MTYYEANLENVLDALFDSQFFFVIYLYGKIILIARKEYFLPIPIC